MDENFSRETSLNQKSIFEYLRKLEKLKGSANLDKIVKFINENFDSEYKLKPNNKLSHEFYLITSIDQFVFVV